MIRFAQPDDASAYAALLEHLACGDRLRRFLGHCDVGAYARSAWTSTREHRRFGIVDCDAASGDLRGVIDVAVSEHEAEIGLVVHPADRRRGVGTRLLGAALADLARRHISRVVGATSTTNGAAQHLLHRAHFAVERRERGVVVYARARDVTASPVGGGDESPSRPGGSVDPLTHQRDPSTQIPFTSDEDP
jgi:ribosomal protein S18 acetylase RimI-like enzyme